MKYEVLKSGCGKDGRSFDLGAVVELDQGYAEHLVKRGIVKSKSAGKKKERAVSKPDDLERAVEE